MIDVWGVDCVGAGLGRPAERPGACSDVDGGAEIHVAGALPGERVRGRVEHVSPHGSPGRTRAFARLIAIEQVSPDRVTPTCPAFGRCGGCPLQMWAYARQIEWKRQRVRAALARVPSVPEVGPCVPSPLTIGYRNQAKLVFGFAADGRPALGGYAPRSHTVVDTTGCALVEPALARVAAVVRHEIARMGVRPFVPESDANGDLRHVVLRANADGQVLVTLVSPGGARARACARALSEALMRQAHEVIGVLENVNAAPGDAVFGKEEVLLRGRATMVDVCHGERVELTARAFFQVNRSLARRLYQDIALQAGRVGPVEIAIDVYAGVGLIARMLSHNARTTIAIESNPAAARAYTARSDLCLINTDAAQGLATIARADLVVVNPPRAGCGAAVLAQIVRLAPRHLIYVSCHPDTLARDLIWLCTRGFGVSLVVPYDMMPHTPHVETLVLLRRSD